MRGLALGLAFLLIANAPLAAYAQRGGGGGGRPAGGGGGARPAAPAARPAAPAQRPAAPAQRPSNGSFNFNSDVAKPAPRPPANTANRPQNPPPNRNTNNTTVNRANVNNTNVNRANVNNTNVNRNNVNVNNVNVNRNVVVNNPRYNYNGGSWGWNHGVAWYPAPNYWGGGFWGALAVGVTSAAVFGAIVNSSGQSVQSYQVQSGSPGAQMLQDYQLTQTQCGPPNLVVIYGPNNSAICAYPNNVVSAGYYNLDTSTLTLSNAS